MLKTLVRRAHTALRCTCLAVSLTAACRTATSPDDSLRALYDEAWADIDAHYAFFDVFHIDWAQARLENAPTSSSEAGIRTAICGLVNAMRSHHGGLFTPAGTCGYYEGPTYASSFHQDLVERSLTDVRVTQSGRVQYARLDIQALNAGSTPGLALANIGYIRIESFEGSGWGGADMDEALTTLGHAAGIVIDVRGNSGGSEDIAASIAARFADRTRLYRYGVFRNGPAHDAFAAAKAFSLSPAGVRFSGPVAVVTDRRDHSATENFVEMMRVLPEVETVGDTTAGTASNPLRLPLSNGWTLQIPQSIETTPDGFIVEGRGLPPTWAVFLDPSDVSRGVDTVLREAAVQILTRLTAPPDSDRAFFNPVMGTTSDPRTVGNPGATP